MTDQKITKKQLLNMIDSIEKHPDDRVRLLGDLGITAAGAALGLAGAGTVAALAGATSIWGVTTAASWLGVSVVAATPVGWIIGAGAAGAAAAYGISRLIRNGAFSEGEKNQLLKQYRDTIRQVEAKEQSDSITTNDRNRFMTLLKKPIEKNLITPEDARHLIDQVEGGLIPLSQAYDMIHAVVEVAET